MLTYFLQRNLRRISMAMMSEGHQKRELCQLFPEHRALLSQNKNIVALEQVKESCYGREVMISSLATGWCFWARAVHVLTGHRERWLSFVSWHKQPCGRGNFASHLFAKRIWRSLQPLGGQLWAACPGQMIQAWGSKERQGISIKPSACQRGCKCLACLPRHADDVITMCTSISGAPQGLPEPQWVLTSLLSISELPW